VKYAIGGESRTRKDTIVPAPDAAAAPFAALDALLVTALATAAALTLVAMLQQEYNTKNNTSLQAASLRVLAERMPNEEPSLFRGWCSHTDYAPATSRKFSDLPYVLNLIVCSFGSACAR